MGSVPTVCVGDSTRKAYDFTASNVAVTLDFLRTRATKHEPHSSCNHVTRSKNSSTVSAPLSGTSSGKHSQWAAESSTKMARAPEASRT
eukprot:CAMPEP_0179606164 /NCGR_PEP_ID=MMETSP0930-20121108/1289_1 /TAXON_ID=548131 ORGANISM="Ostreococcus mediterraneus, Strain clade-D-RCC1621" /NCGR_SAMPLE_ID=MMETSP0930 /ASSEMBLY_ACC=CAM_ASM_000580 /LENGTH=88 /DNA_ID=CAMNT_0021474603 /DNA_START=381 /DNA_END=644 /DNA_ORIENTATION=+